MVHLIAFHAVELYVSKDVLAEYRDVLGRPKFCHLDSEDVSRLLAMSEAAGTMVEPTKTLTISAHPSDNRFYECADAAEADYIVTGNLNARQLLQLLQPEKA